MRQKHRGVTWEKQKNKWKARVGGKFIGFFDDYDKAGECAKKARQILGLKEYGQLRPEAINMKDAKGASEKIELIMASIRIMESDIANLKGQIEAFAESISRDSYEQND